MWIWGIKIQIKLKNSTIYGNSTLRSLINKFKLSSKIRLLNKIIANFSPRELKQAANAQFKTRVEFTKEYFHSSNSRSSKWIKWTINRNNNEYPDGNSNRTLINSFKEKRTKTREQTKYSLWGYRKWE